MTRRKRRRIRVRANAARRQRREGGNWLLYLASALDRAASGGGGVDLTKLRDWEGGPAVFATIRRAR